MNYSNKPSLLWTFFRQGKEQQASFLFGSMHQFPGPHWPRRQQLLRLLKKGNLQWLATETALNESDGISLPDLLHPTATSWTRQIPPKRFQTIRKLLLKSAGIDIVFFQQLPPFILLDQLHQAWLSQYSSSRLLLMDQEIWLHALQQNLHCVGLESHEEHYGLLTAIPLKDQVRQLLITTRNIRRSRKKLLHLYRLYQDEQIYKIHQISKRSIGKERHSMLYQRNQLMSSRISTLADKAPGLAVVGAAHLAGKMGILRLLKKAEWKVKKVKFE